MQAASSHTGSQRWLVPILLAIIVPLLFAALPGEPVQTLARDAGLMKSVRHEIALLHAVRIRFRQARDTEPDIFAGRSIQAPTLAIAGAARALDGMTDVAAVRDAIDAYARAFKGVVADRHDIEPAAQPMPVSAPSHTIEALLGLLQTTDETRLREPLLAMQQAAASWSLARNPGDAEQISHWSGIFAARLDGVTLAQATRSHLLATLAAYEHAVLSTQDGSLRQRPGQERLQAAAHRVEAVLANADRVLAAEQRRLNETFAASCVSFVWSLGAALTASLSIVGLMACGRRAFEHGAMRTGRCEPGM